MSHTSDRLEGRGIDLNQKNEEKKGKKKLLPFVYFTFSYERKEKCERDFCNKGSRKKNACLKFFI